ncbi:hypothetical protein L596_016466 [Steinernema carpocapsae]|uniref:G-protein coupled receptors family 1 profile domain-containing protein n=1 Tax=Steinernema carpocapsae TaxID=34508 RepID=A0A4U5NI19_STECR|nr:hypothetical protein L596_016466 [Steinernema carpocapsae]
MKRSEEIALGWSYIAVGVLSLIFNFLVSFGILSSKELLANSSYKILVQINLTLLLETCIHMLSGFKSVTLINFGWLGEELMGAIMNFAWFATMTLTLLLALDRFYTIVLSRKVHLTKWIMIVGLRSLTCVLSATLS